MSHQGDPSAGTQHPGAVHPSGCLLTRDALGSPRGNSLFPGRVLASGHVVRGCAGVVGMAGCMSSPGTGPPPEVPVRPAYSRRHVRQARPRPSCSRRDAPPDPAASPRRFPASLPPRHLSQHRKLGSRGDGSPPERSRRGWQTAPPSTSFFWF